MHLSKGNSAPWLLAMHFFRSTSWLSCHKQHNWDASFQWTSWQRWMARLLAKTGAFCRDSRLQSWFAQRGISWPLDLPGILFWSIALRVPETLTTVEVVMFARMRFLIFSAAEPSLQVPCLLVVFFFIFWQTKAKNERWKMEVLLKFLPQHDASVPGSVLSLQLRLAMVKVIKRYAWEVAIREHLTDFRSKAAILDRDVPWYSSITWYAQCSKI